VTRTTTFETKSVTKHTKKRRQQHWRVQIYKGAHGILTQLKVIQSLNILRSHYKKFTPMSRSKGTRKYVLSAEYIQQDLCSASRRTLVCNYFSGTSLLKLYGKSAQSWLSLPTMNQLSLRTISPPRIPEE